MERFMYRDESFEGSLKEKADEYRMYPSQQSWEHIQKQIRRRNRTFNFKSFGLSTLLLLGIAISTGDDELSNTELFSSNAGQQFIDTDADENVAANETPVISIHKNNNKKSAEVIIKDDEHTVTASVDESLTESIAEINVAQVTAPVVKNEEPENTVLLEKISADSRLMSVDPAQRIPQVKSALPELIAAPAEPSHTTITEPAAASTLTDAELNYEVNVPVIVKQPLKKQIQFYLTSSASYRVLYSDNRLTFGNLQNQNPENVARHTPSIGMEAGAAILFPASKNVRFRTGLQLNYTRYNVEVFRSSPQVATISFGSSGTVQRISALRADSGSLSVVKNETFQLAIPVGFEFKLAGKRNLQFHMAANVQPTYLLSASGYFLTNDLKKYVKAPDLLSNLNLNSSIETFFRWNMNDIQLQAGPQLRYQLFSNTRGDYPIKEHLVDYGFRIGLVKTLR
ncbi:hypothetical protein ESA94_11865 [Lacibacter luteus]|uniref:Outer membrane protein beta-barrel domain-containing protein n=1 Tax=Lacibacter luteus TaxID=2508719 RepID=A0A4Q1CHF2_9BACT|nr:hypothetical protein [Lacibacter luteus]RXK59748.1 hypothetical protein ESA94_11865 [Lacibacter luteus]